MPLITRAAIDQLIGSLLRKSNPTYSDASDEESSSYSEAWVQPEKTAGLFTALTAFHLGDLVRVEGYPHLYRVAGMGSSGLAEFVLTEVLTSKRIVVSAKLMRTIGRSTGDEDYDSGFSPSFLSGISTDYLFLVGSANYQVLCLPRRGRASYAIEFSPLASVDMRKVFKPPKEVKITRRPPKRGRGAVLTCVEGGEWSDDHQAFLDAAISKARPGFRRPQRIVVVIFLGVIPEWGKTAHAESFEARYRGTDVFFFSCARKLTDLQTRVILGLSAIDPSTLEDDPGLEGRLIIPRG